jgi:putative transposase
MGEYKHSAHAVYDLKYHVIWITNTVTRSCAGESRSVRCCPHRHSWHRRNWCNSSRGGRLGSCKRSSRSCDSGTGGQHLWARGYFCASVGAVDEQTIKQYIENQRWDEDDQASRSPRPPSLEPAVSREPFRRLQPQPDFQSEQDACFPKCTPEPSTKIKQTPMAMPATIHAQFL